MTGGWKVMTMAVPVLLACRSSPPHTNLPALHTNYRYLPTSNISVLVVLLLSYIMSLQN